MTDSRNDEAAGKAPDTTPAYQADEIPRPVEAEEGKVRWPDASAPADHDADGVTDNIEPDTKPSSNAKPGSA